MIRHLDSISNTLRRVIVGAGVSRYEIAKQTGIAESVLSRFVSGDDVMLATADRLAEFFGLKLTKTRAPRASTPRTAKRDLGQRAVLNPKTAALARSPRKPAGSSG